MSDIDWEIRPCEAEDGPAVRALLEGAFDTSAEARLVERLRDAGEAEIELVADSEGTVVGYVLLSRMQSPSGCLALAPVATQDSVREQGIASSLIESGLALATANDWRAVFVLGDQTFYERFGFDAAAAERFSSPYAGEHFAIAILDEDTAPKSGAAEHAAAFAAL